MNKYIRPLKNSILLMAEGRLGGFVSIKGFFRGLKYNKKNE
jgi:hypothetical protein